MLQYALLALVAFGAVSALSNWRAACYALILVGAIQDPVRKLTPGSPAYMVLATVPIWAGIVVGAWTQQPGLWHSFRSSFPRLAGVMALFVLAMLPAAAKSATYGHGSWQITLVGLFAYLSMLAGWLVGYAYPVREGDLARLLAFYCVVTAVMVVGAPMEYLGIGAESSALGTEAMGMKWVRNRSGYLIQMIAGFYRSPDVLGWHSVVLTMLASSLALWSSGRTRLFWVTLAAWGIIGGMLCGRRKMMLMLPIFVLALLWLYRRHRSRERARSPLGVIVAAAVVGYALYQQMDPNPDVQRYYFVDTEDVVDRIASHGYQALIVTYRQSGFWGEGLGTATQGTQHLRVARPRTWQEGGLGRLLVELGVPGFIAMAFLLLMLLRALLELTAGLGTHIRDFCLIAGLGAFFLANAASFIVSHQIFGDPFVNSFFSLMIGLLLSASRYGPPGPVVSHHTREATPAGHVGWHPERD